MHFLYKITNIINNKVYIGQTNNNRRWSQHKWFAKNPEKTNMPISFAINKYGSINFHYQIIATCLTYDDANYLEVLLINQYESHISTNKGYNVSLGGNNAPWTEERKEHMSELFAGENNPFFGKTHSPETLQLMSEAKLGKPSPNKGKTGYYSEEALSKMIAASTGRKQSVETLAKRFSPEAREKMRQAKLGKPGNRKKIATHS